MPCVNRPPSSLPDDGETLRCAFRKESESTMPNEETKHASAAPPVGALGIGGRPKNWLVPVVLLSLREWNSYGYELMGRARIFGLGAMNPGTLYRTLRQMEKDGVVESSWETSRGAARRMYAITGSGEAYLGAWAKSLERYQQSMDDFFKLYGSKPPHADDNQED
jgi:poly-beta-hydroxybutyrate-responsive repressor